MWVGSGGVGLIRSSGVVLPSDLDDDPIDETQTGVLDGDFLSDVLCESALLRDVEALSRLRPLLYICKSKKNLLIHNYCYVISFKLV